MNSLFYPYIDPVTGLPIIDPDIMASLDPNTPKPDKNQGYQMNQMEGANFDEISMNMSMSLTGAGIGGVDPSTGINYQPYQQENQQDPNMITQMDQNINEQNYEVAQGQGKFNTINHLLKSYRSKL